MTDSVFPGARSNAVAWPLITVAIELQTEADCHPLTVALARMTADDPSFRSSTDPESGQTILHGDSELYLDGVIDDLIHRWGIALHVGAPNVAYREILMRKASIDHTHKMIARAATQLPGASIRVRSSQPVNQFARVVIVFEPGAPGSGFSFTSEIVRGAIPKAFIPGVVRGLETAVQDGLTGYPAIDVKATVIDGAFHDLDSSVVTFAIAARDAFKRLREKGGITVVEPVMAVEVVTPHGCLDAIVADLRRRGSAGLAKAGRDDGVAVTVIVRLQAMLGYGDALAALTNGRASFTMTCDHYAPVPNTTPSDGLFPPAIGMRA